MQFDGKFRLDAVGPGFFNLLAEILEKVLFSAFRNVKSLISRKIFFNILERYFKIVDLRFCMKVLYYTLRMSNFGNFCGRRFYMFFQKFVLRGKKRVDHLNVRRSLLIMFVGESIIYTAFTMDSICPFTQRFQAL